MPPKVELVAGARRVGKAKKAKKENTEKENTEKKRRHEPVPPKNDESVVNPLLNSEHIEAVMRFSYMTAVFGGEMLKYSDDPRTQAQLRQDAIAAYHRWIDKKTE